MTKQFNRPSERQRLGMSPSVAEEVAVVETLSLRCFQRV